MSPEDQKFFDDARDLFLSEGWKAFQEELELMMQECSFDACHNAEEFWQAKAKLSTLRRIQAYEDMVKQAEGEFE